MRCGLKGFMVLGLLFALLGNHSFIYGITDDQVELTLEEQEYIASNNVVQICVDPDWYPYEKITASGAYYGIAAELIELISFRTGIEFEVVPTQDWTESIQVVKEGRSDGLAFLNETEERSEWLIFTDAYYSDPNVMITKQDHDYISDLSRLSGETVVLPEGTSVEERIRKEYPNVDIIIVKTEEEAIDYVSRDKADLTIRSLTMAAYVIKSEGLFNLKIAGELPDFTNYFKIGLNQEMVMVKQILDKGIATITPEDIQRAVNKHISIDYQEGIDYQLIIGAIILFSMILSIFLIWNRKLKKLSERVIVSEKLYRSILNASPDAIVISDIKGSILIASASTGEMLRVDNEDLLIGRSLRDFIDEKDHKKLEENFNKLIKREKKGTSEYIGLRVDGNRFIMEANSDVIDDVNDQVIRIVSIIRDVSERRDLEESLKKSEENARELIIELEIKNRVLKETTIRDALTGIRNRYYFDQRIIEETNRSERHKTPISMMFLDLDKFKLVNDTYGHEVGDEVLIRLANKINSMMRKTDIFARWGGEEFVVLLPQTTLEGATQLGSKINEAAAVIHHPQVGTVTISIGIAQRFIGESVNAWFNRCDKALYIAKNTGRNKVYADRSKENTNVMEFEWNPKWSSGNITIDSQHQHLLQLASDLLNHSGDLGEEQYLLAKFDELIKHVELHFKEEEAILGKLAYEDLEEHIKKHNTLIQKSKLMQKRIVNHEIQKIAAFEFVVGDVIMDHMIKDDMRYFPLMAGKNLEG